MWPIDLSQRVVVLIDGGAGSGKTTLAAELATDWPRPVQCVPMDAFYRGWTGLATAAATVVSDVLRPVNPGYYRWDWELNQPAEWVPLSPDLDLIVEGCGAITPASVAAASWSIWCDCDTATRRALALARDGELFAPHWDEWAAQEAQHWTTNRPQELADFVVRPAGIVP